MRILLIEDDELVADAVVRGLSQAGFTVDHAGSRRARPGCADAPSTSIWPSSISDCPAPMG